MKLYPLKFKPILKQKVWGGERIRSIYRHDEPRMDHVGESWDVVAIDEQNDSVALNGILADNTLSELTEVYMGELVGEKIYDRYGLYFPLMVKIIDAADKLSVQVHPDDATAERLEQGYGKEEMWYVLSAEPGADVMLGFNRPVSREELDERSLNGTVEEVLQRFDVHAGDVFHIPAGVVHSIGKGCTMLEIQQASDVTYRLYDYGRLDTDGRLRELHLDEALQSIDYENWQGRKISIEPKLNDIVNLIDGEKFSVNIIEIDRPKEYEVVTINSFILLTCVQGHVSIQFDGDYITIVDGETILIPAETDSIIMVPSVKSKIIETFIKS